MAASPEAGRGEARPERRRPPPRGAGRRNGTGGMRLNPAGPGKGAALAGLAQKNVRGGGHAAAGGRRGRPKAGASGWEHEVQAGKKKDGAPAHARLLPSLSKRWIPGARQGAAGRGRHGPFGRACVSR
jgi:hypothetical protein